jgi:hypothetical protein
MTDEMIALSRRAVACPKWRWMPGMLAYFAHDGRYTRVSMPDAWGSSTALPDLTDPATLGCLLALVRDAYADARITVVPRGARVWAVVYPGWLHMKAIAMGKTEAEALVVALEGAP